jgi:hypothetical protein
MRPKCFVGDQHTQGSLDFVSVILERIRLVLPMNLGIGSLKAMHNQLVEQTGRRPGFYIKATQT